MVTYYMYLLRKLLKRKKTNIYWATTMCQVDIIKLKKLLLCSCKSSCSSPSLWYLHVKERLYYLQKYLICGPLLKEFWGWRRGAAKEYLPLSYHLFLHTQHWERNRDSGETKASLPSPPLPLCLHLIWTGNSRSLCVSYLSMKGFRMVIPSKKNIRTEKPIIANPSSMARSSAPLDGSFLCTSGGSPSLWSMFLFLPEVEKAVLCGKREGDISVSS